MDEVKHLKTIQKELMSQLTILQDENKRLDDLINKPELRNFSIAIILEAAHQREQWILQDERKTPEDWFWLLGYLSGKALSSCKDGNKEKALHHTISSAAVLAHWHESITYRCMKGM